MRQDGSTGMRTSAERLARGAAGDGARSKRSNVAVSSSSAKDAQVRPRLIALNRRSAASIARRVERRKAETAVCRTSAELLASQGCSWRERRASFPFSAFPGSWKTQDWRRALAVWCRKAAKGGQRGSVTIVARREGRPGRVRGIRSRIGRQICRPWQTRFKMHPCMLISHPGWLAEFCTGAELLGRPVD
jgi:hypothetical protein